MILGHSDQVNNIPNSNLEQFTANLAELLSKSDSQFPSFVSRGFPMPSVATIVAEKQTNGIWNARFAHSVNFFGEGECTTLAVWRLIDGLGWDNVDLDGFAETEEIRRDDYRVFRLTLKDTGRNALR